MSDDFKAPAWLARQQRTFRKDLKEYRDSDHFNSKDISRSVSALSERAFGLSAKVSQGTRPTHVAGKRSYKRV
jgi:hypothetical protein